MNWFEQGSNYSGREDLVRSNYVVQVDLASNFHRLKKHKEDQCRI
jgi:hypothetical protein